MKRPWNTISPPVYSLITYDDNNSLNMNICTYVSPISMKPKMYMIAIDYTSKTFKNLEKSDKVVLQLLSSNNLKVIRKLGKVSGRIYDKERYLQSYDLLENWKDHTILKDISAVLELEKKSVMEHHGDHAIFFFDVTTFKTFSETNILSFQDLVKSRIIL
ncbi:MAG: flavin reductase family protein [Flavobacteriales bacterium]